MNNVRPLEQGLTLAWRSIMKIRHSPDMLLDIVLLPITQVLVFVFLFGNAISGNWHSYLEFVLPGIAVQALLFAAMGTGVGLNADKINGIIDRLKSLPISRSAPLIGYLLGDIVKYVISLVLVFGLGAAIGFRTHAGILSVLAACGIIMLFSFAVCWIMAFIGILAKRPQSVPAFTFVVVLPLIYASNVFVPTLKLPGWLQAWVKVNPVTQVSDAARGLMISSPPRDALLFSLLWVLGIIAVFGPLTTWAYNRRA